MLLKCNSVGVASNLPKLVVGVSAASSAAAAVEVSATAGASDAAAAKLLNKVDELDGSCRATWEMLIVGSLVLIIVVSFTIAGSLVLIVVSFTISGMLIV